MRYSKYPSYKDSGVEWMGEIPEHWGVGLLSSLFTSNKEKNTNLKNKNLLSLSYGNIIRKDIDTLKGLLPDNFSSYQIVKDGYIILRLTDLQNDKKSLRTGYVHESGIITSAYIGLVRKSNAVGYTRYFHLYLHSFDVHKGFYGMGAGVRQGLNFDELKKLKFSLPPLQEQQTIANYLDKATDKIDTLIVKQTRLIELLKEKRQAVISTAVTRGLDSTVAMKDSGVEWLGEIPEGWTKVAIKRISSVGRGASPRPIDDIKYFDDNGEYSWVRIADVSKSNGYLNKTKQQLSKLGSSLSVKMHPNDLFVSIAGTVGKPCITNIKACIHDGFVHFPQLPTRYIKLLYRIFEAGECYGGLGKMGTQLNLNTETIGAIHISIAPDKELSVILDYLDEKTQKIDTLITKSTKAIELLKEKRTALISAVVTGKIDVREISEKDN